MQRFHDIFPTADELTTRTPEELAPILLRLAQALGGNGFIPESITQVSVGTGMTLEYTNGYPFHKKNAVDLCLNSAWRWMERQGLIEPAPGMNGRNGWRIITADGVKVIESDSAEKFLAAKDFPKSLLHPRIREKCWSALARGDYPGACRGISQGILATEVMDAQKTPRSPPVPPRICYGPTVTGKSVIDTVCIYVTAHHEYDDADIGLVAFQALREAFPCR